MTMMMTSTEAQEAVSSGSRQKAEDPLFAAYCLLPTAFWLDIPA